MDRWLVIVKSWVSSQLGLSFICFAPLDRARGFSGAILLFLLPHQCLCDDGLGPFGFDTFMCIWIFDVFWTSSSLIYDILCSLYFSTSHFPSLSLVIFVIERGRMTHAWMIFRLFILIILVIISNCLSSYDFLVCGLFYLTYDLYIFLLCITFSIALLFECVHVIGF